MSRLLADLLATDSRARGLGCGGLHPRLRAAITDELRFPARSSGPDPRLDPDAPRPEVLVDFPRTDGAGPARRSSDG